MHILDCLIDMTMLSLHLWSSSINLFTSEGIIIIVLSILIVKMQGAAWTLSSHGSMIRNAVLEHVHVCEPSCCLLLQFHLPEVNARTWI